MRDLVVVIAAALAPWAVAEASTFTICPDGSGDFQTFDQAFHWIARGDTVQFCDGRHKVSIDLEGVDVVFRSIGGDPTACVIDLQQNTTRTSGTSVVSGLTLTGGYLGILVLPRSQATVAHCIIQGNHGNYVVGGIHALQCQLDISDTRILDNSASQFYLDSAGGISVWGGDTNLQDCVIAGNHSPWSGAAINATGGTVTATHCLITGNVGFEGAILDNGTVTLSHCTVASNAQCGVSRGDGFRSLHLDHTLLWGNCFADLCGIGLALDCSMIDCDYDGTTIVCGGFDPLFCGPVDCSRLPDAGGDYHLAPESPAATANCGLMGALGVQCSPISVKPSSWGRMKARYRE
jgi:hypothetical protein